MQVRLTTSLDFLMKKRRCGEIPAAVDRQENIFALGRFCEPHMIAEPALDSAALIIIGACALGIIFRSALKTIYIKLTHIGSDFFKVFNELVISHADTPLS